MRVGKAGASGGILPFLPPREGQWLPFVPRAVSPWLSPLMSFAHLANGSLIFTKYIAKIL